MHLDSISHLSKGLLSVLLCSGLQTKVLGYKILHCEIMSALCHFLYPNSQIILSHPALEHSKFVRLVYAQ
jgi:hypothetical protein